jgi:acetylornithine deacetylase/succinyl-diaminopimelate desuccinylase-like protein
VNWDEAAEESVQLLKDLVRIPTVNPPGNEKDAADLLARLFDREGVEYTTVEPSPGRTSIVARLKASKPSSGGALLLNGHLDVVAADAVQWTQDPFAAVEADGYIWGRGTVDMKNMVAMSAMTLVLLRRSDAQLSRDVVFAGVADEECGSRHGSLYLVENHPDLVRCDYVLGEVGGHTLHMGRRRFYPVQVAEKGICWLEMTAAGTPGHGSMPHADNAVTVLADAVQRLRSGLLTHRANPVVATFLHAVAKGGSLTESLLLPLLLRPQLARPLLGVLARVNPERARGLAAIVHDTVSATMLQAGVAANVIPASARAVLDGRMMPGVTVDDFRAQVQRVVGDEVTLNALEHHDGVTFDIDTPLFSAIEATVAHHDPGAQVVPYLIPAFTDAFAYARLGAVCYGFSPVRLARGVEFTDLYHGHDERIPRDGYIWGQRVLYDLVHSFCTAPGDNEREGALPQRF